MMIGAWTVCLAVHDWIGVGRVMHVEEPVDCVTVIGLGEPADVPPE